MVDVAHVKAVIESVPRTISSSGAVAPAENKGLTITSTQEYMEHENDFHGGMPSLHLVHGVDLEVYKYFNLSPSTIEKQDLMKLQKIQAWAQSDTRNIHKILYKLRMLEQKIGKGGDTGDSMLRKIYTDIRMKELNGKPRT